MTFAANDKKIIETSLIAAQSCYLSSDILYLIQKSKDSSKIANSLLKKYNTQTEELLINLELPLEVKEEDLWLVDEDNLVFQN